MDMRDLYRRFEFEPAEDQKARVHDEIRDLCRQLALNMDALLPDCRETVTVMVKIEEVMFWANAGVARHDLARH